MSNAHYGMALCKLLDNHFQDLGLTRSRPYQEAQRLLENVRVEKERRALERENNVTQQILSQYQESRVSESECNYDDKLMRCFWMLLL